MDWFRWWHGSVTDPKFQLIAKKTGVNVATVLAVWASLLEYASSVTQCNAMKRRGDVSGFHCDSYDALLGLDDGTTHNVMSQFVSIGLVMDDRIANWEKRQPTKEDYSTDRVRKFREKQQNETPTKRHETNETPLKRHETPCNEPDRDTDKEKDTDKDLNTPPIVPPTGGDGTRKKPKAPKAEEKNLLIEQELFGTEGNPNGIWQLWTPSRRGTKSDVLKAYKSVRKESNVAAIRAGVEEYMRSAYVTSRVETQNTTYIKTLAAWLREQRWELAGTGAWDEPCQEWKRIHASENPGFNYNGPCRVINFAPRDGTLG